MWYATSSRRPNYIVYIILTNGCESLGENLNNVRVPRDKLNGWILNAPSVPSPLRTSLRDNRQHNTKHLVRKFDTSIAAAFRYGKYLCRLHKTSQESQLKKRSGRWNIFKTKSAKALTTQRRQMYFQIMLFYLSSYWPAWCCCCLVLQQLNINIKQAGGKWKWKSNRSSEPCH